MEPVRSPAFEWHRLITEGHVVVTRAFATGSVLLDHTGEMAKLVALAQQRRTQGPRSLEPLEIANWRIRLTDLARDLEGLDPRSPTQY